MTHDDEIERLSKRLDWVTAQRNAAMDEADALRDALGEQERLLAAEQNRFVTRLMEEHDATVARLMEERDAARALVASQRKLVLSSTEGRTRLEHDLESMRQRLKRLRRQLAGQTLRNHELTADLVRLTHGDSQRETRSAKQDAPAREHQEVESGVVSLATKPHRRGKVAGQR